MVVPVGSNVQNKDSFPIAGLWPEMRYMLRVTATNSAGTTVAEYTVTTLAMTGGNTIYFVVWHFRSNFQILHTVYRMIKDYHRSSSY
jgi:hypothetical protein